LINHLKNQKLWYILKIWEKKKHKNAKYKTTNTTSNIPSEANSVLIKIDLN